MYWLEQSQTVTAGSMVVTGGTKLGGGVLPGKDGEGDNARRNTTWESVAFELDPLSVDISLPCSSSPGSIASLGPTGCHLGNYHCIPEHRKDLVDLLGGRVGQ